MSNEIERITKLIHEHPKHFDGSCKAQEILNWVNENDTIIGIILDDDDSSRNKWDLLEGNANLLFHKVNSATGFSTNDLTSIIDALQ